jgi:SNF2 family DNA or RNA helicase
LTAIDALLFDQFAVSRVLVIAPLRVAECTWAREAAKWDHLQHLRVSRVLGCQRDRLAALEADADVYVINRENVKWLVDHYKAEWPFDMVVIDELSSFKSSSAVRFRSLRKVRPMVARIVGLTGTPAPNGLMDLWPQIYLLDRGERLGKTITGYRDRYFTPGRRNQHVIYDWSPKPGAQERIHEKLSDLCVSMSAADWLDVPERLDRVIPVALPAKAREQYDRLEREWILSLPEDGVVVGGSAAIVAGKLLQLANGAVYTDEGAFTAVHDAKLEALAGIIEEANGHPVLVFYSYRHDLARIEGHLAQLGQPVRVLGGASDIDEWNAGKIPVLLAHPASAGHGLNLQAGGNVIVWFGLTWSLELYQQANARLHRQGQAQAVIVHHLVAAGTVDEDVMAALGAKAEGQQVLLDAVKARVDRVRAANSAVPRTKEDGNEH